MKQNNTSLFTNQPKGDGDTCDSKKCKLPVRGAHAARTLHAREGDRYTRIRQLSLIGEIGDCIAVKTHPFCNAKIAFSCYRKNFRHFSAFFSLIRAISTHILVEGASKKVQHFITFLLTRRRPHQHITQENLAHLPPLSRLRENLSAN